MGRPFSYSSRPQKACMVLCGHPRPFLGPLWNYTPILGGFNLYWRPKRASIGVDASIWGVNSYWHPFFESQLVSTPFWGVDASIEGRQFSTPLFIHYHPSFIIYAHIYWIPSPKWRAKNQQEITNNNTPVASSDVVDPKYPLFSWKAQTSYPWTGHIVLCYTIFLFYYSGINSIFTSPLFYY